MAQRDAHHYPTDFGTQDITPPNSAGTIYGSAEGSRHRCFVELAHSVVFCSVLLCSMADGCPSCGSAHSRSPSLSPLNVWGPQLPGGLCEYKGSQPDPEMLSELSCPGAVTWVLDKLVCLPSAPYVRESQGGLVTVLLLSLVSIRLLGVGGRSHRC